MTDTGLRALIVDDEPAIRRFLIISLESHGYAVFEAETGQKALQSVAYHRPDVVVLDLGLPDIDGIEVTRRLREWTQVPIIVLSVRDREGDKIAALDAGADDYVTKPFGMGELLARLRAAMRHIPPAASQPVYECEGLKVDLARRRVAVGGVDVQLTPTEYDILRTMVTHAGKVLTHRQLLREVWGVAYENERHLLRTNISNLRRKIEKDPAQPQYIISELGVGYRLTASEL
jgi:two-component system, OmpR family, KDP operon response regulator KdpE